jgi:chromosome segregation ATPase
MIGIEIFVTVLGALITGGGAVYIYLTKTKDEEINLLRTQVKEARKEIEELHSHIAFLDEMLNYSTTAIIDIADKHKDTSEALDIAREIQKKVSQRKQNKQKNLLVN